jgi:hypothetical protein
MWPSQQVVSVVGIMVGRAAGEACTSNWELWINTSAFVDDRLRRGGGRSIQLVADLPDTY